MVTAADTPLLEVRGVSKTFDGTVRALDDVSITVHRNEIVGVVGENGAGKSTLMKILVGVYAPDGGQLCYQGRQIPFPRNPKEAAIRGISIVYQEQGVVPGMKVYEFLFLGHEDRYTRFSVLQTERMKRHARQILEELHAKCDVESLMQDLPLSTQKMVEIVRAILSVRLEQGTDHSKAFERLGTPDAKKVAEKAGVADPQNDPKCLKCHTTAYGAAPAQLGKKYAKEEGITCEACHGPGGGHVKARLGSDEGGDGFVNVPDTEITKVPAEKVCTTCHNKESPTFKPFKYADAKKKIAHPDPRKAGK